MCTVTYLPTGSHTFILTSSRDERISRESAYFPVHRQTSFYGNVLFPQDGDKGGTWIASSDALTVCLLNGAFENHVPQPPYRISRGLVVLAIFEYVSADAFIEMYDLQGIEPFTMILIQHAENIALTELRWNGKEKYVTRKEFTQPHIWSSVTLYSREMMKEREEWFNKWLWKRASYESESIRNFHQEGGKENKPSYSIRMNRPGLVATVSITTIVAEANLIIMYYEDLAKEELAQESIIRKAYLQQHE